MKQFFKTIHRMKINLNRAKKIRSGQSIVEVIIAISILVIIGSSSIIAVLGSFSTTRLSKEQTRATYLAEEGIEAVKSIKNQGWENLVNGEYGVSSESGKWAFAGNFDVSGKYTRKVKVSDVYRINGEISKSEGEIDPDTKKITSSVSWNFSPTRENNVSLIEYLTNWQESKYKGPRTPEAAALTVDTSSAYLTGGFKNLEGITIGNTGTPLSITIDQMKISWTDNQSNRMTQVYINGSSVWGPGLTSSGNIINITNTEISSETSNIPINRILFNKNMKESVFEIIFTMMDGSTKTVSGIGP